MKIRYVLSNAYSGRGTTRTTLNMANALAARGHDVEIVSLRRLRKKPVFSIDPRVKVRILADFSGAEEQPSAMPKQVARGLRAGQRMLQSRPSKLLHPDDNRYSTYSAYTDLRLLRFLRSTRDGVIVGTRPAINLAIARFARRSVIKIGQEHLNLARHEQRAPDLVAAFKRYYPGLDAFTTLTTGDAAAYRTLIAGDLPILAVPNAAPEMGGVRAELNSKVVIAAGRLSSQKGFYYLVKSFAKVAAKHPDWQLHIFGHGAAEDGLRRLMKRLDVDDNVLLRGFTSELPTELGKASIYALSSRFEGFPMVLLEAMKVGLPAVSFDCPTGPRDLIDDGHNGFIVPLGDVDALARGIIELIEDPPRRVAMGAAAFATTEHYTSDAIAQRWENVFSDVARRRGIAL